MFISISLDLYHTDITILDVYLYLVIPYCGPGIIFPNSNAGSFIFLLSLLTEVDSEKKTEKKAELTNIIYR